MVHKFWTLNQEDTSSKSQIFKDKHGNKSRWIKLNRVIRTIDQKNALKL